MTSIGSFFPCLLAFLQQFKSLNKRKLTLQCHPERSASEVEGSRLSLANFCLCMFSIRISYQLLGRRRVKSLPQPQGGALGKTASGRLSAQSGPGGQERWPSAARADDGIPSFWIASYNTMNNQTVLFSAGCC